MVPTLKQILAAVPESKQTIRVVRGPNTTVARRWRILLKGTFDLFESGAVCDIDEQKKTIVIRLNQFKAVIGYSEYPLFISDWILKIARNYEDLL